MRVPFRWARPISISLLQVSWAPALPTAPVTTASILPTFPAARAPGRPSLWRRAGQLRIGYDTAGSGRVPAAFNNLIGLKPTLGTLSCRGVVPACRSLDSVSIFALTADDARRVYAAARWLRSSGCVFDSGRPVAPRGQARARGFTRGAHAHPAELFRGRAVRAPLRGNC